MNLNIVNTGMGGDTIRDLERRWEKDCIRHKPDILIKQVTPQRWSDDTVHPYVWAHAWIVERWLEVTGL